MYFKSKFFNGTTLITAPVPGTEAITALALFPVGSRYESLKQNGLSHFIEHMMFKGTKKRPTTLHISKELDNVGAEYNAYTSRDYTGYYVKVASPHINLALDLLSDMIWNSKFDEAEVNREKGVIIEEINMYQDNPTMYIEQLFEEAIFSGHPLGRDIAGTAETVKNFSRSEIIKYYKNFYQPQNLILVLAGKVNKNFRISKFLNNHFSQSKKLNYLSVKVNRIKSPQIKIRFKKTDQVHVALGFPAYSYDDPRLFALTLLNIILGGTMSSRLFTEVRERRGLAYMVRSGLNNYQDIGNLVIQAGLDKNRLAEALKVILKELKKMKEKGVTAAELKMAKENITGRLVLNLEDSSAQAEWYGKQALLMKKIMTPDERLKKYQTITLKDIKKVAEDILKLTQLRLAVIGPYQDGLEIQRMLKI